VVECFVVFAVVMFVVVLVVFLFAACFVSARADRIRGGDVPPDGDRGLSDDPQQK
jgi:heme/copper-type cytochrome/quinol oxidase subunit 2